MHDGDKRGTITLLPWERPRSWPCLMAPISYDLLCFVSFGDLDVMSMEINISRLFPSIQSLSLTFVVSPALRCDGWAVQHSSDPEKSRFYRACSSHVVVSCTWRDVFLGLLNSYWFGAANEVEVGEYDASVNGFVVMGCEWCFIVARAMVWFVVKLWCDVMCDGGPILAQWIEASTALWRLIIELYTYWILILSVRGLNSCTSG